MKKHLLLLICIFSYSISFSQVTITEDFNSGTPAGWTDTYGNTSLQACSGNSERDNIYSTDASGNLTSPNQIGVSNGTDITFSIDYKVVDWFAATNATADGWGTAELQYSLNDGSSWTTAATIDDSNDSNSNICTTFSTTIMGSSVPNGSDLKFRVLNTWAAGDYYFYIDDFTATQVGVNPPNCDAALTSDLIDFSISGDLTWSMATGAPTGYKISVGSSMGGTDIANNVDVGTSTSYTPMGLMYGATYYSTITPYNDIGDATGCSEEAFVVEPSPNTVETVNCGSPSTGSFCYDNNEDNTWLYTSADGTSPLQISFSAGEMESCCDDIIIYDGTDATANVLYSGNNSGDLSGLVVSSTGPNLYFVIDSDGSVSCVSNGYTNMEWSIDCLSCTPGAGTAAVGACDDMAGAMIDVEVTSLGDGSIVIKNDGGVADVTVSTTGVTSIGPFSLNSSVVVTLAHPTNSVCDVVLSAVSIPVGCPPVNDNCSAPGMIVESTDNGCGMAVSGTTQNASIDAIDYCSTSGKDVWYSFTPSTTEEYNFEVSETNDPGFSSTYVSLFSGSCGSLTQVNSSCFSTSFAEDVVMGTTYLINVRSSSSSTGVDFDLCAYPSPPPPANDECMSPDPLMGSIDDGCAMNVSGTTISASIDGTDFCSSSGKDVWYSFTPSTTEEYNFEVSETNDPGFSSTYVSLFSGSCGSLTQVNSSCFSTSFAEDVVMGTTYLINVRSTSTSTGVDFDLCAYPSPPPPANDASCSAQAIVVDDPPISGSNQMATAEAGEQDGACWAGSDPDASVWYTFDAPATGNATVSTDFAGGSLTDTQIAIYSASSCSDLAGMVQIGCDDDDGVIVSLCSIESLTGLTPETAYYVQVDGYNTNKGSFQIQITSDPQENNACASATVLAANDASSTNELVDETMVAATASGMASTCEAGAETMNDLWYTIETNATDTDIEASLTAVSAGGNLRLELFSGTCGALTSVACDVGGILMYSDVNPGGEGIKGDGEISTRDVETYYLRVLSTDGGEPTFTLNAAGSALPIELSNFTAKSMAKGNMIQWSTLSEINSDYIEVESSPDGSSDWTSIGKVITQGESTIRQDYELVDKNPKTITYYRLNAIDKDGRGDYSEVISVERNDNMGKMALFPNPTSNDITLQMSAEYEGQATISILNLTGKLMKTENVILKKGVNTLNIVLDELPSGVYVFNLATIYGNQIEKVVKR